MRNSIRNINDNRLNERQLLYGEVHDKSNVKKFDMIATDHLQCNVRFSGRHVFSRCNFRCGDIIELCPVRKVTPNALYSREVRDMAIEVIPGELWCIPMGYCQFYDVVDRNNPDANCRYEWNVKKKCIIIRAIVDIPKDTILVVEDNRRVSESVVRDKQLKNVLIKENLEIYTRAVNRVADKYYFEYIDDNFDENFDIDLFIEEIKDDLEEGFDEIVDDLMEQEKDAVYEVIYAMNEDDPRVGREKFVNDVVSEIEKILKTS